MRERLIELLKEAECAPVDCINCEYGNEESCRQNRTATYLLANGVIVLPCAVGDTVYMICHKYTKCSKHREYRDEYNCQGCEELECDSRIDYYIHTLNSITLDWIVKMENSFGETAFLTKEEAEAKLAELKGTEE